MFASEEELIVSGGNGDEQAALRVAVCVPNELQRYGLEAMLKAVDIVDEVVSVDDPSRSSPTDVVGRADVMIVDSSEDPWFRDAALRLALTGDVALLWLVDDSLPYAPDGLEVVRHGGSIAADELDPDTLREALWRTHRGETVVSSSLITSLMDVVRRGTERESVAPESGVRLTPREREALDLLVDGLGNKQIARRMGISVHGAKRLVANILAKMGCTNRTQVVAKVLREGLYQA